MIKRTNCLSLFDHFVGLTLKGIIPSHQCLEKYMTGSFHLDFVKKIECDLGTF